MSVRSLLSDMAVFFSCGEFISLCARFKCFCPRKWLVLVGWLCMLVCVCMFVYEGMRVCLSVYACIRVCVCLMRGGDGGGKGGGSPSNITRSTHWEVLCLWRRIALPSSSVPQQWTEASFACPLLSWRAWRMRTWSVLLCRASE